MCRHLANIIETYVCCLDLRTIRRKLDAAAMYVQYKKITPDSDVQMTDIWRSKIERDVFMTVRCKNDIAATYVRYLGRGLKYLDVQKTSSNKNVLCPV